MVPLPPLESESKRHPPLQVSILAPYPSPRAAQNPERVWACWAVAEPAPQTMIVATRAGRASRWFVARLIGSPWCVATSARLHGLSAKTRRRQSSDGQAVLAQHRRRPLEDRELRTQPRDLAAHSPQLLTPRGGTGGPERSHRRRRLRRRVTNGCGPPPELIACVARCSARACAHESWCPFPRCRCRQARYSLTRSFDVPERVEEQKRGRWKVRFRPPRHLRPTR